MRHLVLDSRLRVRLRETKNKQARLPQRGKRGEIHGDLRYAGREGIRIGGRQALWETAATRCARISTNHPGAAWRAAFPPLVVHIGRAPEGQINKSLSTTKLS